MHPSIRYRCGLCGALTFQLLGQTTTSAEDDGTRLWKPLCSNHEPVRDKGGR